MNTDERVYIDSNKLKKYLKKNNLSYSQASVMCGRHPSTISKIIRDGYTTKTFYTFMCNIFDVHYERFLPTVKEEKKTEKNELTGKVLFDGNKMLAFFKEKGITMEDAAAKCGFTSGYFTQLLSGKEITAVSYQMICRVFDADPEIFLSKPENEKKTGPDAAIPENKIPMEEYFERQDKRMDEIASSLAAVSVQVDNLGKILIELLKSEKEAHHNTDNSLEQIKEDISVIRKKTNANTIQLEKIKDFSSMNDNLSSLKSVNEIPAPADDPAVSVTKGKTVMTAEIFLNSLFDKKNYVYEQDVFSEGKKVGFREEELIAEAKKMGIMQTFSGCGNKQKKIWIIKK